jgi:small GTP-binding protein
MKCRRTDEVDRRCFLSAAAAAVVGVAFNPSLGGRGYANDFLKVCADGDANSGPKVLGAGQVVRKKVCMLGASAVGKTSLARRYVESLYGDKYLDTVGVKIDKKEIDVEGRRMVMLLWDIKGQDFQSLTAAYLRNASGILLVVDGTRRQTLDVALDFHRRIHEGSGPVPSVVLMFNKDDLSGQWEVRNSDIETVAAKKIPVIKGSAKTGKGVEDAFLTLAAQMLAK